MQYDLQDALAQVGVAADALHVDQLRNQVLQDQRDVLGDLGELVVLEDAEEAEEQV